MAKFAAKISEIDLSIYDFFFKSRPLRNCIGFEWTSSEDAEVEVAGTIVENRYKLSEEYKVTLKPHNPAYAAHHFYTTDLRQLIAKGQVTIKPKFIDYGIGT